MNIQGLASSAWDTAVRRCPKQMRHGPCAGVRANGACEARDTERCSFLDVPDRDWPYPDTRIAVPRGAAPGPVPRLPVDGVNLSGAAEPGNEVTATRAMAEIARRVLGAAAPRRNRTGGQA
jgi:hypothetical protein